MSIGLSNLAVNVTLWGYTLSKVQMRNGQSLASLDSSMTTTRACSITRSIKGRFCQLDLPSENCCRVVLRLPFPLGIH